MNDPAGRINRREFCAIAGGGRQKAKAESRRRKAEGGMQWAEGRRDCSSMVCERAFSLASAALKELSLTCNGKIGKIWITPEHQGY
jgi:hypothetical protein